MNVLIVDDNKNNRMILQLLMEDYVEDNGGVTFSIDEAVDGLEAVRKCDAKEYDLILMDIMMPNMDGIEATKLIRQKYKKLMIIAVSAVDDLARQKEILSSGAEDYISKPVNSDIFNSRLTNYISLLRLRKEGEKEHKSSNENGVNVFTKEIYSRYTNFMLFSEDALSELWEYYLLDGEEKCDNLSDVIRTIFSIGEAQLKLQAKSNLFVEESDECKYFTLTDIDTIPLAVIKLLLKKNEITCEYKIADNKLSFKLYKLENSCEPFAQEEPEKIVNNVAIKEEIIASPTTITPLVSGSLEVFDYLDPDDLIDLEEYAGRLNSLMLLVGKELGEDEVFEIYTYIDKLSAILATYSEVAPISKSLARLAEDMSSHIDTFIENAEALAPMCAAFSRDMSNWITQSFHTGAPSEDFMNDTISVNCQTIGSMLTMNDASAEGGDDFDDIFDF